MRLALTYSHRLQSRSHWTILAVDTLEFMHRGVSQMPDSRGKLAMIGTSDQALAAKPGQAVLFAGRITESQVVFARRISLW
jgi:hypothetical protein